MRFRQSLLAIVLCACVLCSGCSRSWYRTRADEDAFAVLGEKASVSDWSLPDAYNVEPDPESGLFDDSSLDIPTLPDPTPRLHGYQIPPHIGQRPEPILPAPEPEVAPPSGYGAGSIEPAGWTTTRLQTAATAGQRDIALRSTENIILAQLAIENGANSQPDDFKVEPITVPPDAWESIPRECLSRMFEFPSVRDEYATSFGHPPTEADRDQSTRLSLDDAIALGLLNSREYQSQKEQLYRVALRLSLQRFDYDLKFAPFGNGTGAEFTTRGSTVESSSQLGIPTNGRMEALLNTGSTFVTRFANEVLLTFNGPDGFAADISSELLFDLTHSVFQNDVRFERLTQAERNVVYAARDFMRFRRSFYLQIATQYYNLLRSYRQVEIDTLNYVGLARVYAQRRVELDEGQAARVQIDQVEQNALAGRSRLIGTCNGLENSLDRFKLLLGLPTESPLNLDLSELQEITRQDEIAAEMELVHRARQRLSFEVSRDEPLDTVILNKAAELVARIRDAWRLQQANDAASPLQSQNSTEDLVFSRLIGRLRVAEMRLLAQSARQRIETSPQDDTSSARLPTLSIEFARTVLDLLAEERRWAAELNATAEQAQALDESVSSLQRQLSEFETQTRDVFGMITVDGLASLQQQAKDLQQAANAAAEKSAAMTDQLLAASGDNPAATSQQLITRILLDSQQVLDSAPAGLRPVTVEQDGALLAALNRRLDLMNARGELADEWRRIKLASDNLKSVLDLNARQRLFTHNESNRPFEFDFEESRTELAITLDTPLNRRVQRNTFREQLLNYQVSRRAVMELEDSIKRNIRVNLRALRLAEEQYALGIASSALARERVISTQLQLQLGVAGVKARDYLEAQTAYASALSDVADRHIGHILSRIGLFVEMEQLQLDDRSVWPGLYDGSLQPEIDTSPRQFPAYDELPPDVQYSDEVLNEFSRWDGQ
jgi:hypothetical protein